MKKIFCLILCLFVIIICIACSLNNFFNIAEETVNTDWTNTIKLNYNLKYTLGVDINESIV